MPFTKSEWAILHFARHIQGTNRWNGRKILIALRLLLDQGDLVRQYDNGIGGAIRLPEDG